MIDGSMLYLFWLLTFFAFLQNIKSSATLFFLVRSLKKSREYSRFVTPGFRPFDPMQLARETEKMLKKIGNS